MLTKSTKGKSRRRGIRSRWNDTGEWNGIKIPKNSRKALLTEEKAEQQWQSDSDSKYRRSPEDIDKNEDPWVQPPDLIKYVYDKGKSLNNQFPYVKEERIQDSKVYPIGIKGYSVTLSVPGYLATTVSQIKTKDPVRLTAAELAEGPIYTGRQLPDLNENKGWKFSELEKWGSKQVTNVPLRERSTKFQSISVDIRLAPIILILSEKRAEEIGLIASCRCLDELILNPDLPIPSPKLLSHFMPFTNSDTPFKQEVLPLIGTVSYESFRRTCKINKDILIDENGKVKGWKDLRNKKWKVDNITPDIAAQLCIPYRWMNNGNMRTKTRCIYIYVFYYYFHKNFFLLLFAFVKIIKIIIFFVVNYNHT